MEFKMVTVSIPWVSNKTFSFLICASITLSENLLPMGWATWVVFCLGHHIQFWNRGQSSHLLMCTQQLSKLVHLYDQSPPFFDKAQNGDGQLYPRACHIYFEVISVQRASQKIYEVENLFTVTGSKRKHNVVIHSKDSKLYQ